MLNVAFVLREFAVSQVQMKKPKFRTVKDQRASKERGWDLNPGLLTLTCVF